MGQKKSRKMLKIVFYILSNFKKKNCQGERKENFDFQIEKKSFRKSGSILRKKSIWATLGEKIFQPKLAGLPVFYRLLLLSTKKLSPSALLKVFSVFLLKSLAVNSFKFEKFKSMREICLNCFSFNKFQLTTAFKVHKNPRNCIRIYWLLYYTPFVSPKKKLLFWQIWRFTCIEPWDKKSKRSKYYHYLLSLELEH